MKNNITRLSVHKNNKAQRGRKLLRRQAVVDVKECVRPDDVAGYCIVSWSKNKDANICWDIIDDSIEPKDMPDFIRDIAHLRVTQKRMED